MPFGSYVQYFEDHHPITNNVNDERTTGALFLGPTGNQQGGYKFFSLTTGRQLLQYQFTRLPMPADVIQHVNNMATKQKQLNELTSLDRNHQPFPEYVPNNDNFDDDDGNAGVDNNNNNPTGNVGVDEVNAEVDIVNAGVDGPAGDNNSNRNATLTVVDSENTWVLPDTAGNIEDAPAGNHNAERTDIEVHIEENDEVSDLDGNNNTDTKVEPPKLNADPVEEVNVAEDDDNDQETYNKNNDDESNKKS